jgi:serine phosphatase RsbU (regulator of sigma subunit)
MYNRFKLSRKQNEIIANQKLEVEKQKEVVDEKNKNITDSINYALRIQRSFLPKEDELKKYLGEHFIIYRPKDIVSGDFYWMTPVSNAENDLLVLAVGDCTGHGVPGAMMTMIGNTLLNQTIGNFAINTPAEALDFLNKELPKNLKKQNQQSEIKDGMDMVMCELDRKNMKMYFSGANNTLYLIRDNVLTEFKGDKQAISASDEATKKPFTPHEIDIFEGDCFYMSTDGIADQFGGLAGKKFKSSRLKELLIRISDKEMIEQKKSVEAEIDEWMFPNATINYEQVDDICIIGFKI